LDLGDLDKSWGSGVKTLEELQTVINSINSGFALFNELLMMLIILSSLVLGDTHIMDGIRVKLLVSLNLSFELDLHGHMEVVQGLGGHGDARLRLSDSLSNGGFPLVVLGKLNLVVFLVDIDFELVVSKEILEGLDQVTDG
jgi:hypothetical protein